MAVEKAESSSNAPGRRPATWTGGALAAVLSFAGGLATGRFLYEWRFPALAWLGRPLPALLFAAVLAVIGLLLWRTLTRALVARGDIGWNALLPFLPLLLNLGYLPDPAVDLTRGRLLFLGGLWLALLLLARLLVRAGRWRWLAYVFIWLFLLPVYLATMGRTVGTADTFEFQVVVPQSGIVHPTGYPLYLLLAKPFTWLPFGTVAWRVNLATLFFGLLAASLLYTLLQRWSGRIIPSLLAAVVFGLTPTFWSQAIEAEVYSLHALIVAGALLLMREIGGWGLAAWGSGGGTGDQWSVVSDQWSVPAGRPVLRLTVLLALVLGLGLTNHLTTVILLPVAALAVFLAIRQGRYDGTDISLARSSLLIAGAFLLPLLLYAYLPIRWAAVNGGAMGWGRFVDWVIGGRFQGALQLTAWLRDGARYEIVGRLLADQWPVVWAVPLVVLGLLYAGYRSWRFGLILVVAWLGYLFYALNYYVPDLTVFLIPAYLIMAVFWAAGLAGLLHFAGRLLSEGQRHFSRLLATSLMLLAIAPALFSAGQAWTALDRSGDDGRTRWGQAVLDLPLAPDAAILADSAKFPPLYYLQQAEGLRPDLDIVVLPDEAAYRSELDSRLAAGQTVYLARFLPGLESIYHLRSLGPLVEVSATPIMSPPEAAVPLASDFGPIRLLGYLLSAESPYTAGESVVTFYWQAAEPLDEVLLVYTRWAGDTYVGPASSQHPAGNTYPTVAWRAGEIVADFHALPQPMLAAPGSLALEVALAPPFAAPDDLTWQAVAMVAWDVADSGLAGAEPLRMVLGPLSLDGLAISEPVRDQAPLVVRLSGYAKAPAALRLAIVPGRGDPAAVEWQPVEPAVVAGQAGDEAGPLRLRWTGLLPADLPSGNYRVLASYADQPATCAWLAKPADYCLLDWVALSDALLPPDAVRFDNKIALLSVDIPEQQLAPGGRLTLTLTWQTLAQMNEDYTVFVQVVDQQDHIVGQVDSWPRQGTYPTSSWAPGEIVEDPYLVPLDPDLPPGQYRLYLGWYLLETLRRLPVLDQDGRAVDDKVVVPGLFVPG